MEGQKGRGEERESAKKKMSFTKDWDKILEDYSDNEGEEENGDEVNILSVQKNARRVAQVLQQSFPSLSHPDTGEPILGRGENSTRDTLFAGMIGAANILNERKIAREKGKEDENKRDETKS